MKFHILAYQHHLMKLDNSEGKITCAELTANIKRMKNEKKSWISTSEFFKFFWNNLGKFVFWSINYGHKTDQL